MSFWAAGISAAGAIGGGLISANGAKSAASKAADANLRSTQETNALNKQFFDQGRGAPGADGFGHSILPTYFGGNEEQMGQQAYQNFMRLSGAGDASYGRMQGYQNSFAPSVNSGIQAFNNRFNGQDLNQRIDYSNPYFQSRLNQAQTTGQGYRDIASANSSAINTGLGQLMAQLNAQRGSQGFLGGSTFDRNRMLQATMGARQQAAVGNATAGASYNKLMSDAQFANAGDLRGLQFGDLDNRSRLDAFPAALSALSGYESAPAQALSGSFSNAMTPLNYFRIAPQTFQAQNNPAVSPNINGSMMFGSALSQLGGAGANYFLQQSLAQRYGQPQGGGFTQPKPDEFGPHNY